MINVNLKVDKPKNLKPVIALIRGFDNLGFICRWWEVVYYDEDYSGWNSFSDSTTFDDGEKVVAWRYTEGCSTKK